MKKSMSFGLIILAIMLLNAGLTLADLNQELENIMVLNNTNTPGIIGAVVKSGPDFTTGTTNEYLIEVKEVATDGLSVTITTPSVSTVVTDWNAVFDSLIAQGYNVEFYAVVTPSATVLTPTFLSGSTDASWPATYDWASVPDGSYAVEIVKTDGITVSQWKLVKREGDLIVPQTKITAVAEPIDGQELKDQFVTNSTVAIGNFSLLGNFTDKDIWVYDNTLP